MGWVVNVTLRPPHPRERNAVPVVREARWGPAPVWRKENPLTPTGVRTPNCPARRLSLYGLSSPGPHTITVLSLTFKKHILQRGIPDQLPGASVSSTNSVQDLSNAQRSGSSLKHPLIYGASYTQVL